MRTIDFRKIFATRQRGLLLDVLVFVVQMILMTVLSRLLANLTRQANHDLKAKVPMAVFCLALVFLPTVGSILRRRSARERSPGLQSLSSGLWFPVAACYFLSQLLFLIAASSLILESFEIAYGKDYSTQFFGLLFVGLPALAILNTATILLYYVRPKQEPLLSFLKSPQAEWLGDTLLFVNMIGYQMFWGYLMMDLTEDYSGILARLSTLAFTALIIYIPPRLFYLVEERDRPWLWLTMLLSNLPLIVRILFVTSSKAAIH
ncbi:MAG: hypothetical protein WBP93_23225 [Pyrinomonadaceae bacterium]